MSTENEPATTQIRPAWGMPDLKLPEGTKLAWGARAIYKLDRKASLTFMHDRQQMNGGTDGERKAFAAWINHDGLPALRAKLVENYVDTRSSDTVTIASDGYALAASPRGSCGYLYITAWKVPESFK